MIGANIVSRPTGDLAGRFIRIVAAVDGARARSGWGSTSSGDPEGPARLFASFYDLIGQTTTADAVRERGLDPVQSKLSVMVIALVIGTVGVWLLYVGLNGAVDLLGRPVGRARSAVRLHRPGGRDARRLPRRPGGR